MQGFGFLDQSLEDSGKTENEEKLDLNAALDDEDDDLQRGNPEEI